MKFVDLSLIFLEKPRLPHLDFRRKSYGENNEISASEQFSSEDMNFQLGRLPS